MVTITNEAGTFEAETEKQALRFARKGMKQYRLKELQIQKDKDQACLIAKSNAYHAYQYMIEHDNEPAKVWQLLQPRNESLIRHNVYQYRLEVSGDNTTIEVELFSYRVEYILENGGGYVLLLFVVDCDDPEKKYTYAIGSHQGQYSIVDVPGMPIEKFKKGEVK